MEIVKNYFKDLEKRDGLSEEAKKILYNYTFNFISNEEEFINNPKINKKFSISKSIIFNQYIMEDYSDIFLIIFFSKTIIIIPKYLLSIFIPPFNQCPDTPIYFLSESKQNFDLDIKNEKITCDEILLEEIYNLNQIFKLKKRLDQPILQLWQNIQSCISLYLITQAYTKTKEKQFSFSQTQNYDLKKLSENDFVILRNLGFGSLSHVELIYVFEKEELFALKKPLTNLHEYEKLNKREIKNLKKINFPILPKLYGTVDYQSTTCFIIQYINGQTLENIQKIDLSFEEKINIIFEMMMIVEYFHNNNFVYRDLKPDNVIIDDNKNVFIIDFDRMIKINDEHYETNTINFQSAFVAPEVNQKQISYQNDIYSIGQMIMYIITEEDLNKQTPDIKSKIHQISDYCTKKCPEERPTITLLMNNFLSSFSMQLKPFLIENADSIKCYEAIYKIYDYNHFSLKFDYDILIHYLMLASEQNNAEAQFSLGFIYYCECEYIKRDINQPIRYLKLAANQNHLKAQLMLGDIYYEGKYITRDIKKSIHYYSLAANQNQADAQYNLGVIYYEGKYIKHDINKSIHYFTLAANLNHIDAQIILGRIYYSGKFIQCDINKSIHYFSLAANQNDPVAQFNLGYIYYEGKYITQDINKSIHYYSLAANQNQADAQYHLGNIYYEGKYITQDINKSINYFSLAANQNHPDAQFVLGNIYYEGKYITQDINKSIHYFTLAANQNIPEAQYNLGDIYYSGKYITRDINKSIHFYSLAADQNIPEAQNNLGFIYYSGKYITRDINKSIYYLTLAANQNISLAQFQLGLIYYEGKYIKCDINKSIHFLKLATYQNHPKAQFQLGLIHYDGKYFPCDINKSIHYFTLAANQNIPEAQFNLGLIYYSGKYIIRDINKSIYFFSLAADQHIPEAQFNLGFIYYSGKYITRDINKSIHYLTLAANQNIPQAQFALGNVYYKGEYITQDINKSIHFYLLAANQNHPEAQYNLGNIYYKGKYITRDINKSIHYFSLAANQNIPFAQLALGFIYSCDIFTEKNIIKGIDYFIQSASNGNIDAHFAVGYFYNEGKYVEKDIKKSIHHYKESSSFNNQFAKNNLGIIYKHGFGKEIPQKIGYTIEYFEEAIRRNEDKVSMYNLSHIYIYEYQTNDKIDQSIQLLIESSKRDFTPSDELLCIVMIKKHGFDIDKIRLDLTNITKKKQYSSKICQIIKNQQLLNEFVFEQKYQFYKNIDFIYDFAERIKPSILLFEENPKKIAYNKNNNHKSITADFYEGFGIHI